MCDQNTLIPSTRLVRPDQTGPLESHEPPTSRQSFLGTCLENSTPLFCMSPLWFYRMQPQFQYSFLHYIPLLEKHYIFIKKTKIICDEIQVKQISSKCIQLHNHYTKSNNDLGKLPPSCGFREHPLPHSCLCRYCHHVIPNNDTAGERVTLPLLYLLSAAGLP